MKISNLFFLAFMLVISSSIAQTYLVGHRQITYQDPARGNRNIQTEIYYPAATAGNNVAVETGSFPIIVFGHGFAMAWDAYQNIWEDLVPQGYIIAFPRTEGSLLPAPDHDAFGKDLAFLITKLQSENTNASSPFFNHINNKSAIMGHSMGGGSSFLAAKNNTNITTMVTFAAANTNPSSITAAQNVTVPSLVIAAANDCVAPPADHQIKMYDSLASECKTYLSITGAAHCEFANYNFNCSFGQTTCSPQPTISGAEQKDVVSDFTKLWFQYYLKDNCNAWTIFNDSLASSNRVTSTQGCTISNPVINQSGVVLQSTPGTTYQWYLNGNAIVGANSQNYTATQSGNYYVEVTYYNTCPYPSNTINISITGLHANTISNNLSIYPNPANEFIVINYSPKQDENNVIRLRNIMGQIVIEKNISFTANNLKAEKIELNELRSGIYFLEIKNENISYTEKIIKK